MKFNDFFCAHQEGIVCQGSIIDWMDYAGMMQNRFF